MVASADPAQIFSGPPERVQGLAETDILWCETAQGLGQSPGWEDGNSGGTGVISSQTDRRS